jgi:kynurenine formamidase
VVIVFALVVVAAATAGSPAMQSGISHATVTSEQFEQWKKELSNWGRWGSDDDLGALNLITPAKRKEAAALVREGVSISLALEADTVKALDNPQPYEHRMLTLGTDYIGVAMHGVAHTHLDSLAHIEYDGVFYNGYKPDRDAVMKNGHTRNSIVSFKNGILTRGILVDLPRMRGVPYLEPGTAIFADDLEAWEKYAGVRISSGDALFVNTGNWVYRKKFGPWDRGRQGRAAGLHPSVIPWLKQRDIAVLASDHPQGVNPINLPSPVHNFSLYSLGIAVLDNCDLEALSEATASRRRWEFMFTVAPLAVRGATGSPVNPIATF